MSELDPSADVIPFPSEPSVTGAERRERLLAAALDSRSGYGSMVAGLVEVCGSVAAVAALDDNQPAESARLGELSPVAASLHDRIMDRRPWFLDDESLLLIERLLVAADRHSASPLRRRAAPDRVAAGVVWLSLALSGRVGRGRPVAGLDVWHAFGVTSCSDLAHRIVVELDGASISHRHLLPFPVVLGDPGLLHSAARRTIVAIRELVVRHMADEAEARCESVGLHEIAPGVRRINAVEALPGAAFLGADEHGARRLLFTLKTPDAAGQWGFGLSICDARDLLARLEHALGTPSARVAQLSWQFPAGPDRRTS